MCTPREKDTASHGPEVHGYPCPVCGPGVILRTMRFADPHGAYREDPGLVECSAQAHTFARGEDGVFLVSENGRIVRPRRRFAVGDSGLSEETA